MLHCSIGMGAVSTIINDLVASVFFEDIRASRAPVVV